MGKTIFTDTLKSLNTKQGIAVDQIEGPVMVIAGPGTGKTHTLTIRIANILKQTDIHPSNILALTFTDNAAANMRKRLRGIIGNAAYKVKILTFHSFCNEVIQRFPDKFGFSSLSKQITDLEKIKLLENIIDDSKLEFLTSFNDPYLYKRDISKTISDLKRESISPEEFAKIVGDEQEKLAEIEKINPKTKKPYGKYKAQEKLVNKNFELQKIYAEYQAKLQEEELYDYDDMILFVTEKFQEDEELLAFFQEQYLYVLVDEFQDTNGAQSKILELLASFDDMPNLFVVGDDAQSIYRFQGANIENMYEFLEKYPKTKIINLKESYRCPPNILKGAESLITNNKTRLESQVDKAKREIETIKKAKGKIAFFTLETIEDESYFILEQIETLLAKDIDHQDIAVLYRNHSDVEVLRSLLAKKEITTNLMDSKSVLDEEFVLKFLNLLKVLDDLDNDQLLFEVLAYDFLGLERLSIFKLGREAGKAQKKIIDLLEGEPILEKIQEWSQKMHNMHLVQFLELVLNESGLLNYLKIKHDVDSLKSLSLVFNFAKNISKGNWDYRLTHFLADLNSLEENRISLSLDYTNTKRGINLMTAHRAKGLEFDHVFIMNLQDGKWSNKRIVEKLKLPSGVIDTIDLANIDKNEEERRLLYVAMTRAKKTLTLSFAKKSIQDGRERELNESQFANEIGRNFLDKKEHSIEPSKKFLNLEQIPPLNLANQEKEYLRELINNFRLSATSLNNYLEDPRRFLYENLLRIPTVETKPLILGSIIHRALEGWNRDLENEKMRNAKYYLTILDNELKKFFLTKQEFEEISKEAAKILTDYLKQKEKDASILEMEYSFYGHNVMLDSIALNGKIDAIQLLKSEKALKKEVRIVDYKTSTPKSRNFILGKTQASDGRLLRQLQFYKLLTELDDRFPYKAGEFELAFVKPNNAEKYKSEIFSSDEIDTEEIREIIKDTMKKIRGLKFDPK